MGKVCFPKDLNKESIGKILQDHFNDSKIKVISFDGGENFLAANDNFNSVIKKWKIVVEKNGSQGEKITEEVNLIVKASHQSRFHGLVSPIARAFVSEVFWFNIAYPELAKLYPEIVSMSPVCYYGYSNYTKSLVGQPRLMERMCCMPCWPLVLPAEAGILLLENLCAGDKKLKVLDKNKILTYQQARIAFETLAKFHGVWLKWRFEAENLCKNQTESSLLKLEDLHKLGPKFKSWMVKSLTKDTSKILASLLRNQAVPNEIIIRWEKYATTRLTPRAVQLFDLNNETSNSKIMTVCHGDVWSNNMMFSQDDDHVTLIDFQMIGLHHPSTDLWYFLTVNTDREFRAAHLRDLLHKYFSIFKTYLEDVNIEMNFEEFLLEFEERRDMVFAFGILTLYGVLSPNQISMNGLGAMSELNRRREEDLASVPKPDDHTMVVEIRRRLVGLILDAAEANFF